MTVAEAIPLRRPAPEHGWALLAVVPAPHADADWQPADPSLGVGLVRAGALAALVCPAPAPGTEGEPATVAARHWEVHRALLRGDVVPAPAGVVFGGHEDVRAFLLGADAALRGAMQRVAGRWEFRLHVTLAEPAFSRDLALDLATHIYAELRRISAAAVTLPDAGRLLGAAFLVDRSASPAFQDRLEVLSGLNAALALDLTGPWPPYDFVAMHG